jgi:ubiquinone/menaquinone biosynthesis C-methylase UbiE/hypothetical membrane protein
MAVTQLGWTAPYSLLNNQISDLGSAHCGYAYGGNHYACSPWPDVFNASAVIFGTLVIIGVLLIRRTFPPSRARGAGLSLLILAGFGSIGVGVFPWDVNGIAHYSSSLTTFLCADLALLTLGVAMAVGSRWHPYRGFTFLCGTAGLVALLVYLAFFGHNFGATPGLGGVERVAVGPALLWTLVLGFSLARHPTTSTDSLSGNLGQTRRAYRGFAMEGYIARRYSRDRKSGNQIENWRRQAGRIISGLREGASILEVAPGPGYFSIEMARLGRYRVTGLDISHTFVDIARENAKEAGVAVDFHLGDASDMGFPDASFDLIVCQAAFKNFSRPAQAIGEMHRVLRNGGTAVIQDMRKDASDASIRDEVDAMRLGRGSAFMTRRILRGLRRRAYTKEQFEQMATASAFGGCEISTSGIGVEVRLRKQGGAT